MIEDKDIWTLYTMLPPESKKRINHAIKTEMVTVLGAVGVKVVMTQDEIISQEPRPLSLSNGNTAPPKEKKIRRARRKGWKVHGRTFPSAEKLCEFYNITVKQLNYRLYSLGDELEDFLPEEKKDMSEVLRRRTDSKGNKSYVVN